MQQAQITNGTEVQNEADNCTGNIQDNTQTDSQSPTCHSSEDDSQASSLDASHYHLSNAAIAPFVSPPLTAQFPSGPHYHLPGNASVEELLICGDNFFQTLAEQCNLYVRQ